VSVIQLDPKQRPGRGGNRVESVPSAWADGL